MSKCFLSHDKYQELIFINKKDFDTVIKMYESVAKKYGGHITNISNKLKKMEELLNLTKKDHIIQLMEKDTIINKKDTEILLMKKDHEIEIIMKDKIIDEKDRIISDLKRQLKSKNK
jgi:esterase/lipase